MRLGMAAAQVERDYVSFHASDEVSSSDAPPVELGFNPNIKVCTPTRRGSQYFVYMLRHSSWGYDVLAVVVCMYISGECSHLGIRCISYHIPGWNFQALYILSYTLAVNTRDKRGNTFTKGKRVVKYKRERDVCHRRRHH